MQWHGVKTSAQGLAFIAGEEWVEGVDRKCGYDASRKLYFPYRDYRGIPTFGAGHKIRSGEDFSAGRTIDQVRDLQSTDMGKVDDAIDRYVRVLAQHQHDALASFGFNCGTEALNPVNCTFVRQLNAGDWGAPCGPMGLHTWNHSQGQVDANLTRRRLAEEHLWVTPWPEDPIEVDAALFDLVAMLRSEAPAHA